MKKQILRRELCFKTGMSPWGRAVVSGARYGDNVMPSGGQKFVVSVEVTVYILYVEIQALLQNRCPNLKH